MFDVGAILNQLQSVLAEVSKAVQLLFLFILATGLLVLAAVLSATRDERVREAAVLRALGATSHQLARAQRVELLAVDAFSGGLAATGGSVIAWALSSQIFDFTITIRFWPCAVGTAVGMAGVCAGSLLPCAASCVRRRCLFLENHNDDDTSRSGIRAYRYQQNLI